MRILLSIVFPVAVLLFGCQGLNGDGGSDDTAAEGGAGGEASPGNVDEGAEGGSGGNEGGV